MAEVIVKFSVNDLDSFYDWLQSAIDGKLYVQPDKAGYDGYFTLVKDGQAVTDFDTHLWVERLEATAIAEALSGIDTSSEVSNPYRHNPMISKVNDLFSE
jgi:hypothetical protein